MKFKYFIQRLFIIIMICVGVSKIYASNDIVKNAWLDLSKGEGIGNKIYKLNGDWKFYYGKTYADLCAQPQLKPDWIKVPGVWNDKNYPEHGYALYRMHVILNHEKDAILGIKSFTVSTAYNLYVNGKKIGSEGTFATNEALSKPDYQPQYFVFRPNTDTIEIAIEVSNYNYRKGGIWFHINLGSPFSILSKTQINLIVSSFLVGAMIIMFFYQLGFFFIRRKEKTSFYFGLLCLMAAIRICSTGEIMFRHIDLGISWEWLIKAEYISMFMMLGFGAMYIRSFFPRDLNWKIIRFIYFLNILLTLFVLLTPAKISSYIIAPYLVLAFLQMLYYFVSLCVIAYKKRTHSYIMLSGYLILFITGINDILYSQEIIDSYFIAPLGVLVFIFLQGFAISRKYAIAFETVDELNIQLKNINSNLQVKVDERTQDLNEKKQYLEHVNQVKDKLFAIISHDLRGPLKSLLNVLFWIDDDELSFEDTKKFLRGIKRNLDNMVLTLENLLQWSKSQLSGLTASPELIDVRTVINECFALNAQLAKDKKVKLINNISERHMVFVDPNHLSLILRNLISNAIKFSDAEIGEVKIQAQYTADDKIIISVNDNGIGIPSDKIPKLFNESTHFTTYGTSKEKGTGIGLMICKEFAEKNNGKIQINSVENKGTTIELILPIE